MILLDCIFKIMTLAICFTFFLWPKQKLWAFTLNRINEKKKEKELWHHPCISVFIPKWKLTRGFLPQIRAIESLSPCPTAMAIKPESRSSFPLLQSCKPRGYAAEIPRRNPLLPRPCLEAPRWHGASLPLSPSSLASPQIGRASCRERVSSPV